jgi:hypothetical protein
MGLLVAGGQGLNGNPVDIAAILQALEASRVAAAIRQSLLLFPLIESAHVIALTLVFGTISILDLRLLGVASTWRPYRRMAPEILKWTWAAFALAALTGSLMFITNAGVYYRNFYFRTKMLLLLLAGLNVLAFELTAGRTVGRWNQHPSAPPAGRILAALSLAIWIGVIVAGRMVGFTTSRATPAPPPLEVDFEKLLQGAQPDSGPPPAGPAKSRPQNSSSAGETTRAPATPAPRRRP